MRWAEFVSSLQNATQLTHLKLSDFDLSDISTLMITAHLTQLQEVELEKMKISATGWEEFISSLHNVQHTVHVILKGTNIDEDTVYTIQNSPRFTVSDYR